MKHIETLPLKKEFEGHPGVTKKFLITTKGAYDTDHYKKYWLSHDFTKFYKNHDATGLCLKEATREEFEKIKLESSKVTLVAKPISEYFKTTSGIACLADFEENKFNYYSVICETKRTTSWCTVRVLK